MTVRGADNMPAEEAEGDAGRDGGVIVCTDAGCWFPNEESWLEFLRRKRVQLATGLEVDGEQVFPPRDGTSRT